MFLNGIYIFIYSYLLKRKIEVNKRLLKHLSNLSIRNTKCHSILPGKCCILLHIIALCPFILHI